MKKYLPYIALVISVVALVSVLVSNNQSNSVGASGSRFPSGISADSTSPSAGQIRGATLTTTGDATIGGGTLNVTTSNTATSTVVVGCIEFYATSTETAQKFQASTTPGFMFSVYGSCPNS